MSASEPKPIGLRERKKIKTRAIIQQHALRLFSEQGYHATTVEQIAEACELSPSTFFRYFPTKEAVVLEDDYDPMLIEAFQAQPPELSSIRALRNSIQSGAANISKSDIQAIGKRMQLIMSVPELRAAMLNQMMEMMELIARLAAERSGLKTTDLQVLTFAGSIIGVMMSVNSYFSLHPESSFFGLIDDALAYLEAGLPLE